MASSSSSSSEKKRMLRLISSDEQAFEVEDKVITAASETIKNLVEEGCCDNTNNNAAASEEGEEGAADIPVFNVDSSTLSKIIQYCNYHHGDHQQRQEGDEEVIRSRKKKWDEEFMESLDMDGLYDLILGANFLAMNGLLDLTTRRVADLIKGKSVAEIRRLFNIENDFTPEEEADMKHQYPWAFEDE